MTTALLYERPFSDDFVAEVAASAVAVFGKVDIDDLAWRLEKMPDASVYGIRCEGRLVAFKVGYAIEQTRYLSWLGGVSLQHRRQGLARNLMDRQHDWARRRGYEFIETACVKFNTAMLTLNLSVGFEIVGTYARTEVPRVMMQKRLSS